MPPGHSQKYYTYPTCPLIQVVLVTEVNFYTLVVLNKEGSIYGQIRPHQVNHPSSVVEPVQS